MGRKLSSNMKATPVVNVTEKEDSFLQGILKERKEVTTQYGLRPVFILSLNDTDMRTVAKEGKEFKDVEVEQGADVAVFAPTMLDRALIQAKNGEEVRIVYKGMGKSLKKGRNAPHLFEVEVI